MHTLRPPTSLRLKELWLLHFKMQIPKREQHYLSLLWNQYRSRFSLSSLPSSRRYSLLLRCLVKRIQKRYKRKIKKYIHKWNFVLGSLNYLHVTSESFSFSKMPRQCWPGGVPRGLFRVNSALHLWDPVALKSLECPVHLFFFSSVCLDLCLFTTALRLHEKKQAEMFYLLSELASIKLMEPFSSLFPISDVPWWIH